MYVGGHLEKIGKWGVRAVGTDPMTIRRGYDGPLHVSVEGHLDKNERPLETGSQTTKTVVQDGPS